ncbi:FAD binding domain protein [Aspergillus udagawae]|nr:FAD binding domain protein [Aspergillus udagawae]
MGDHLRVDVLILGAGPTGLMAATWMAVTGVRTLLVERRPQGTQDGRADGLETGHWRSWTASDLPTAFGLKRITRSSGRVEEHLLNLVQSAKNVDIRRATIPTTLEIDYSTIEDHATYPIRVTLDNVPPTDFVDPMNSMSGDSAIARLDTVVKAKYVLGCDGAHSWLRKPLGIRLEGQISDYQWGVVDFVPITNFRSDIRKRCIVKFKYGTLTVLPREKRLVRAYTELSPMASARYAFQQTP